MENPMHMDGDTRRRLIRGAFPALLAGLCFLMWGCPNSPGEPDPPQCSITPTTLDFGSVQPEETAERSFEVSNTGGGTLTGAVSEECDRYEIVTGGGDYSLGEDEAVQVTVRFTAPSSPATYACTIDTGSDDCGDVECTATVPDPEPECFVDPPSLNFGLLIASHTADRQFTIENTGGGTLEGSVSEDCPHYTIEAGAGAYSLAAGQIETVTVRVTAPSLPGTYVCEIGTGTSCGAVSCTTIVAEPDPECSVSTSSLDFGTPAPGQDVDREFTIENVGGGTLSGSVTETCSYYTITVGSDAYNLTTGQTHTVTIRFTGPETPGTYTCDVETGTSCDPVGCTATVPEPDPECFVNPASLDFLEVAEGQIVDRPFTIGNVGGGMLTGSVSVDCDHYTILVGAGSFALGAGERDTVAVRFTAPPTAGVYTCDVETGASCDPVGCTATVPDTDPACDIDPPALDFGSVDPGAEEPRTLTITNTGGGTLSGTMSEDCPTYAITSGAAYSLGAGESQIVTVVFSAPLELDTYPCNLETGNDLCTDVSMIAVVTDPGPVCQVTPPNLDFGVVEPGSTTERSFEIENVGTGTLVGSVSENCPSFSITAGNGLYSLVSGLVRTVTVRLTAPFAPGELECPVGTGACGDVLCTARVAGPECAVDPLELDFGTVDPGVLVTMDFTIQNVGGGTLIGATSETCPYHSLIAGGGNFYLGAGEVRTVTVGFTGPATPGTYECTVINTAVSCPDVSCVAVIPETRP
jgi:hypothetical protein